MTNASPSPKTSTRWLPGLRVLRSYQHAWLVKDLVAGLALTAILLPAGMAYAAAAGLPVLYGLYATIVPLVAYALFGPSRILVLGPDSALAGMTAATILPLAAQHPAHAVTLAGMLAILSGLMCVVAGLCRFSFITDLLSKPIRHGYLNGIALTVLVSQLPTVLGLPVDGANLWQAVTGLAQGIVHDQVNGTSAAIGGSALAVIVACRRWAPMMPGMLIAVIGATILSAGFDLSSLHGIAVVGSLPEGLPTFQIPWVSWQELHTLLPGAAAIAMVSFADMSVLSRTFAQRCGDEVDGDQEVVALGVANIAAGLFQGFPVTSSASRTPVAETAGAQTQLTSLVGATCIALLLFAAPSLLHDLPHAALGAVVIAACVSLVEVRSVRRLWTIRRSEFALSMVCFCGVALVGVIQGIFIAVALALLAFIWRAWRPYDAVLGRVDKLKGYHDIARHPEARRVPGLVLFRWDAPLFFANAAVFKAHVLKAVSDAPTPTTWIVVAAEPVTDIDVTAADMLTELSHQLQQAGIQLCFAEMKGPVKDLLKRYGLFAQIGLDHFFPTIGQAVDRYVETAQVAWHDWDE